MGTFHVRLAEMILNEFKLQQESDAVRYVIEFLLTCDLFGWRSRIIELIED